MKRSPLYEIYKLRLPLALALSLPALLLVAHYGWSAWASLDRYRRLSGENPAIDLELFHLALHDEVDRDLRRWLLEDPPANGGLPLFELSLSAGAYDDLLAQVGSDAQARYVPALIRHDGQMHEARVRLRGQQPWHTLGVQKSLKVRLDKGDLIAGMRVFNLINDPTPFGLEEQIILDMAREQDLLTPEYRPVWVRLNNTDLGVMRFEAQPAEGLLRRQRRMPGSIYSGDISANGPQRGLGELFGRLAAWEKAAARIPEEEEESFAELDRLLTALAQANHAELRAYATEELDLQRLARFDALDVLFGGEQHDFVSNHKLAFDPYRGRFEPVAWNFRAFTHDPVVKLVDNPMLLRLEALPEFLPLRNRILYQLLLGDGSPAAVRARADRLFEQLEPFLAADPYWDAYKLLARASRYHRFMMRPMNRSRALLAAKTELRRYNGRHRFLLAALEQENLTGALRQLNATTWAIELTVDGLGAYALRRVTLHGNAAAAHLVADRDLNGRLDASRDPELTAGRVGEVLRPQQLTELLAGVRLETRTDAPDKHGTVASRPSPRLYRYLVDAPGAALQRITVELESRVTGLTVRRELLLGSTPAENRTTPPIEQVPDLSPGELSPHLWSFPLPPVPTTVRLGPGVVELRETRVFARHESVFVAPGTTLRLSPKVSLVFLGPLQAVGSVAAPILIEQAVAGEPFGGLLLLGQGTAGSRLEQLVIRGGSHPQYRALYTPSLVNIYDTREITLADVQISGARETEDLVHATYVEDLRLFELTLDDAPIDSVDLELTTAQLRGLRLRRAGDECLDLMTAEVSLISSILTGCTNSALSAGEESRVTVHDVAIVGAKTGILAKNAATVRLGRTLIVDTETALRTNRREVHYDAPSRIDAEDVYLVDNDKLKRDAAQTRVELGSFAEELPTDPELRRRFAELLDLTDLDALERIPPRSSP